MKLLQTARDSPNNYDLQSGLYTTLPCSEISGKINRIDFSIMGSNLSEPSTHTVAINHTDYYIDVLPTDDGWDIVNKTIILDPEIDCINGELEIEFETHQEIEVYFNQVYDPETETITPTIIADIYGTPSGLYISGLLIICAFFLFGFGHLISKLLAKW